MNYKKAAGALFLAFASTTSNAHAGVIGFDDITYINGDPAPISNGYEGFAWSNIWSSRAGYSQEFSSGLVSGANIGFMIAATTVTSFTSTTPFTFNSVNIAKMYYDGLTRFEGYVGDTLVYSKDVFAAKGVSSLATFDWTGLTRVDISVLDDSERVVFDDFTVNELVAEVPEPASIALMLAGLGLAGVVRKRKNKQV